MMLFILKPQASVHLVFFHVDMYHIAGFYSETFILVFGFIR